MKDESVGIICLSVVVAVLAVFLSLAVDRWENEDLQDANAEHAREYGRLPGALDTSRPIEIVPDKVKELLLVLNVETVRDGITDAVKVVPQRVQCSEGAVILNVKAVTQAGHFEKQSLRIYDHESDRYFELHPEGGFARAGFTTSVFSVGAVDGVPDVMVADRAEPIHVSIGYMADSPCVAVGDLDAKANGLVAAERECIAAVASTADGADKLAAGVDACLGIERSVESCMHGAASSYERHGDPERLAAELEACRP